MKYLFIGLLSGLSAAAVAQHGEGKGARPGQQQVAAGQERSQEGPRRMQEHKNPLLNASFWKNNPDVEAVKAEIAKGNSAAEMNQMGFDAVVMAINNGASGTVVKFLVDQPGNDVNKLTHDGRTYVFWAGMKGNTEVMEYVLSKGASATMLDSHGATPLTFPAMMGVQHTGVYEILSKNGADIKTAVNAAGANLLLLSVASDPELKLTEYFISKGVDINSKDAEGNNAADYAVRSGNIDLLKKLQAKGVKPGKNAMLMAIQGGRRGGGAAIGLPFFQYLESVGAKINATNKNGETVLHSLVRRPGQLPLIKWFVEKGVDVNTADAAGNTLFMNAAAYNSDAEAITYLKSLTRNINQKNNAGATPLLLAGKGNTAEIMALLIGNGADITATDAKGNNLTYYVFDSYSRRTAANFAPKMALLKEKGLDVVTSPADGNTLYHLSVVKNDMDLMKIALANGGDINARNKEGLTPLHKAALMAKDADMMRYLLSMGANKEMKTRFDETAYDLAKENEALGKGNIAVDFLKL